jgi:hypothetical protein
MGEERINKGEDGQKPATELTPEELERVSGGARGEAAEKGDMQSESLRKSDVASREQRGKGA